MFCGSYHPCYFYVTEIDLSLPLCLKCSYKTLFVDDFGVGVGDGEY